jgi:uncharacterized GH25 family protein
LALRLTILLLLVPALTLAHDTWLIPGRLRVAPGEKVSLRVATSEAFPESETALAADRVARFTVQTSAGIKNVTGYQAHGAFLVAEFKPETAGLHVVTLESKPRDFVLEPEVFNLYLREEGHTGVLEMRAARGQTNAEGRERYRKIAVAHVCAGEAANTGWAGRQGLWLEIVPGNNTCALRSGDTLAVQIFFAGQPLGAARVTAGYPGTKGHAYPVQVQADAEGRAKVKFDRAGVWFVRVHHIIPLAGDQRSQWESAFSTLTFEVRP